jgi:hypothetical protein
MVGPRSGGNLAVNPWPIILPHAQIARMLARRTSRLILTARLRPGTYHVHDALSVRQNERRRRAGRFTEQQDPTIFAITITGIRELALVDLDLVTVRAAGYRTQRDFYDDWLRRRHHLDPRETARVCAFAFEAPERYLHQRAHRGYTENPLQAARGEPAALSAAELADLSAGARRRHQQHQREDARRQHARSLAARIKLAVLDHDGEAAEAIRQEIADLFHHSRADGPTIRPGPLSSAHNAAEIGT